MKIFPSLRRFARSIEEKGRTSRNGIVLALRLHFWSRVGHYVYCRIMLIGFSRERVLPMILWH